MKRCALFQIILLGILGVISFSQERNDLNFLTLYYDQAGNPLRVNQAHFTLSEVLNWNLPYSGTDDINMVQIGTLVAPMYYAMSGGDSDGDSLFEAYMYIKDNQGGWTFTYRIYENDGNDNYPLAFTSPSGMIPYAYGDQDGDGLAEVIGQNSFWINVYESPGPGHLATQMVWQSPSLSNVTGYTAVGDLDADGLGEIIHSANSFGTDNRLVIYEKTGNNQFQEIYNQPLGDYNTGSKAVGDFDGDGWGEVALSSGGGEVFVIEATENNSFQITFRDNMGTFNAYACSYADDMDNNGRPEFIAGGSSFTTGWLTRVYEAVSNDSFIVRQEIAIIDNYSGIPGNAVGDLDNDGSEEFIIQTAQALHLYKWNGSTYAEEGVIPENFGSILHGVFSYDGNYNGYDEIFWLGIGDGGYWTNNTILLENEDALPIPEITVSLIPESSPIVIPPGGGSFNYTITVHNNEADTVEFDLKLLAVLPGGAEYTIAQVENVAIWGGGTISRQRTQVVPANAPAGNYIYRAQIGNLPNIIWDQDEFPFTKQ